MAKTPHLRIYLDPPEGQKATQENVRAYACRGRRCAQPDKDTRKHHCPDCVPSDDPTETVGDLLERAERLT